MPFSIVTKTPTPRSSFESPGFNTDWLDSCGGVSELQELFPMRLERVVLYPVPDSQHPGPLNEKLREFVDVLDSMERLASRGLNRPLKLKDYDREVNRYILGCHSILVSDTIHIESGIHIFCHFFSKKLRNCSRIELTTMTSNGHRVHSSVVWALSCGTAKLSQ